MRDTTRDELSRQTGEYKTSLKSRLKPRCGPCRHTTKTMASGPLISGRIGKNYSNKIKNLFRADSLFINKKILYLFLVPLVTFCINTKLEALPVFESEIEFDLPDIVIRPECGNSFMNDYLPYPCSWFFNSGLSETQYSEWVPFQDLRYKFLEERYNIIGGSYVPDSIGCPFKQRIKLYIIAQDEDEKKDISIEIKRQTGKNTVSSDIICHHVFSENISQDTSIHANQYNSWIDFNTVPEPSAIVLFAVAALGYLHMKKDNMTEV